MSFCVGQPHLLLQETRQEGAENKLDAVFIRSKQGAPGAPWFKTCYYLISVLTGNDYISSFFGGATLNTITSFFFNRYRVNHAIYALMYVFRAY